MNNGNNSRRKPRPKINPFIDAASALASTLSIVSVVQVRDTPATDEASILIQFDRALGPNAWQEGDWTLVDGDGEEYTPSAVGDYNSSYPTWITLIYQSEVVPSVQAVKFTPFSPASQFPPDQPQLAENVPYAVNFRPSYT